MSSFAIARAERAALCRLFDEVGPDAPTLCEGWTTRDLAAHLVVREGRPDLIVGLVVPALAGRLERGQNAVAKRPWARLVDDVRTGPPWWHPTSLAPIDEFVNTVEMVVHHEDVLRGDGAAGPRRDVDPRTENAVWRALQRTAALMFRRSSQPVELTAAGYGTITARKGDDPVVLTGAPIELLLTAYGRGGAADVSYAGAAAAIAELKRARLGLA